MSLFPFLGKYPDGKNELWGQDGSSVSLCVVLFLFLIFYSGDRWFDSVSAFLSLVVAIFVVLTFVLGRETFCGVSAHRVSKVCVLNCLSFLFNVFPLLVVVHPAGSP